MPIYKIRGIDVDFPFEAYGCQLVYMDKVIQSLQEGCNALLESPTGTGKTLCLLCATLAWRKSLGDFSRNVTEERTWLSGSQQSCSQSSEHPKSNLPVIIYTSRTHSQLKQVIRELKASNYRPKMAVLGSREQMCIHDEVRLLRGRTQNNACHHLCKKRACHHHTRVTEYMKKHHDLGNEPLDIEDLVNIGLTKGPCPYYISRELHKVVDILFAPYNYLIDPGNRRSLTGIQWSNSVLIFDEAHNLEGVCADAASFDLPSGYLTTCISETKECVDLCIKRRAIENSNDKQLDPDNYAILKALLLKLEKRIAEVAIESKDLGFTRPGNYIYEFLSELNITHETANMLIDTIDNAALLLEEGNTSENGLPHRTKGTICRLESIRDILNIIFRDGGKGHSKYYRFHVQEAQPSAQDSLKGKVSRILSWWCFNPGLAMEEFIRLGVRSIILTSGTLSPLDSFALELNLDFPVRLENPHIISPNQVWVGVVPSGPSGYSFNSSYRNRDSLEYKQELGNAIVNFARIVPDGLLVFFPSYYLMDQCIECWKNVNHASSTDFSTIWERICKNKQPVVEPKQSALFPHAIEDFEAKLRDGSTSGAIFFAVCRGKVSEGLDFADQAGRAVVITGLPFSLKTDPKVRLKRDYLDQQALTQKKVSKVLTGEEWYVQQATRAVNQAIGRVIRHRHDYGAIVFCDERFARQNRQSEMSLWLRPHVKCYPKFGDVVFTLTRFFRDKSTCGLVEQKPSARSKSVSSLEINDPTGKDMLATSGLSNPIQWKIGRPEDKIFLSTTISCLRSAAEQCSKKPLSSVLSVTRGNIANKLEKYVPANRSTLSFKENSQLISQRSRGQVHLESRLKNKENGRKDTFSEDHCVVDLSRESPLSEKSRSLDVISPFSSKKLKLLTTEVGSTNTDIRTEHLQVSSEFLPKGQNTLAKTAFEEPIQNKGDDQTSALPHGDKEARGSAFLMQVQEELSTVEYGEFVGLMKALKSKTMKVIPALESIAKLFSTSRRVFLLERFKDFVPAKYRSIYEEHLRAHNAAEANPFTRLIEQ